MSHESGSSHRASLIEALMDVIAARKALPAGSRSYVRSLLDGGTSAITAKITEEAAEVVAAAAETGEDAGKHLVHEVADLFFHTLVLLGERDIAWSEIEHELARRFGVSGIDEKASRGPK